MSVAARAFRRRSALYRIHESSGAEFADLGDAAVVARYGPVDAETEAAGRLAIVDLTTVGRTGFKGRDTVAWLAARGVPVPPEPNRALIEGGGATVARLSREEHLILADIGAGGDLPARLDAAWFADDCGHCWHLPRADSHCRFLVSGEHAADMLAKLCAVDLRRHRFAAGRVAQTSMARIGAIVIAADRGPVPVFDILADSASALYLWDCLLDAGAELGMRPVGIEALGRLGALRMGGREEP